MKSERIDIWRLSVIFVVSAAVPLLIGFGVDLLFPSSISMLMVAGIVSIPIVAFVVSRSVLAEMERVIQQVAPSDSGLTGDAEAGEPSVVLDQLHPEKADRSTI
ncbi:MAG: hypothetical protein KF753_01210 [Caldilineaceae bacterium]|nr:hypothetical protein [Caldilineaceae bacterium]